MISLETRSTLAGAATIETALCDKPLDVSVLTAQALSRVTSRTGALESFSGLVRAVPGLQALFIEAHMEMAPQDLRRLCLTATQAWPLTFVAIHHRIGTMRVGEPIVWIATAASHRAPAQQACQWLTEGVKSQVTLWKCEQRDDGNDWLRPREEDLSSWEEWLRRKPELSAGAWTQNVLTTGPATGKGE